MRETFFTTFLLLLSVNAFSELNVEERIRLLLRGEISISDIQNSQVFAALGGGDIIGNGGGIVESRFSHSYQILPSIIRNCLNEALCSRDSYREDFKRILNVLEQNKEYDPKLIYLSGQENPNFFRNFNDNRVESAKTGFRPMLPIFINLNHLYLDGAPSFTLSDTAALLVHELGHQAEIRSHTYLDKLGSMIRMFLEKKYRTLSQMRMEEELSISYLNFKSPDKYSSVWWQWGDIFVELTDEISKVLNCNGRNRTPIGYSLSNLSWERNRWMRRTLVVPAKAWISVKCEDHNGIVWEESQDLTIDVNLIIGERGLTLESVGVNLISVSL